MAETAKAQLAKAQAKVAELEQKLRDAEWNVGWWKEAHDSAVKGREAFEVRAAEVEQQLEAAGAVARRQELELQQLRAQAARPRLIPRPAAPAPQPNGSAEQVRPQDEPAEMPEPLEPAEAAELTELEREIHERKLKLALTQRSRGPGR
jgi:hypothetical protein